MATWDVLRSLEEKQQQQHGFKVLTINGATFLKMDQCGINFFLTSIFK